MSRIAGIVTALTSAILLATTSGANGQGLADVARQEAARRDTVAGTGKTYTNTDLTPDFTTPVAPAPSGSAAPVATAPSDGAKAKQAEGDDAKTAAAEDKKELAPPLPERVEDEAKWRAEAQLMRGRLAGHNAEVQQLRARLSAFTPGSTDGELRVVEKALERAITNLGHSTEEWVRFEEKARGFGIPDHWIR